MFCPLGNRVYVFGSPHDGSPYRIRSPILGKIVLRSESSERWFIVYYTGTSTSGCKMLESSLSGKAL